jgi:hypothetical protein
MARSILAVCLTSILLRCVQEQQNAQKERRVEELLSALRAVEEGNVEAVRTAISSNGGSLRSAQRRYHMRARSLLEPVFTATAAAAVSALLGVGLPR